ncbi:hypothetical protein SAMN02745165_02208 [Malonomonas rubra DSM 5091]|uniref:Uncharacterized protein n=1 Tax=Malonomonas rubra DSM 5091 TaxID=1122189 RepID=A0A1M6IQX9_MALRU|nr:hypothetical protein [Malonomonas rubra]SHJ36778.1 hypothetical protein SAMN02745165_02208 [Malonomonas rubra DSM 5091]
MARILLINPDTQHCADIKFLLHLNGYQIESCDTIDEGINRFKIFQKLDNAFDLVLIIPDKQLLGELETLQSNPFCDNLIIVHEKKARATGPKPSFSNYSICDPKLVLDCVKYHLKKAPDDIPVRNNGQSTNLHEQL